MWGWQGVLSLLAVAWLLQCVGTWVQIRRYREAFRELAAGWSDGWMGAGKGGRFPRAGAIALVVVAPDDTVRRVVVIKGRTVFAKAERVPGLEGLPVRALREMMAGSSRKAVAKAVAAALDQVDVVRANQATRVSSEAAETASSQRSVGDSRPERVFDARQAFSPLKS